MKVIQLIPRISMGGAETLVKDYCLSFSHDVETVIVIKDLTNGCANEKSITDAGINIISISQRLRVKDTDKFSLRVFNKLTGNRFYIKELFRIIKQEKPDIIHIHLQLLYLLRPIRKRLDPKIKIYYTCHNLPKLMITKKKREKKAAEMLIRDNGMQLIALHEDMKQELNEMFNIQNTVVIQNGINFSRFQKPKINKTDMRKLLGIPEDAFVIGHVGRFHYQKNHEFIIEIFGEVLKQKENAYLIMIGSGSLKQGIIDKTKELKIYQNCIFLENRCDIPEILSCMDVFLFPSRYEGLGIALIEAEVANLRCIISDEVPKQTILTENTIALSLKESSKEWTKVILDSSIKNNIINGDINKHNIASIIQNLEALYHQGLND